MYRLARRHQAARLRRVRLRQRAQTTACSDRLVIVASMIEEPVSMTDSDAIPSNGLPQGSCLGRRDSRKTYDMQTVTQREQVFWAWHLEEAP